MKRKISLFFLFAIFSLSLLQAQVSWSFKLVDKGNGEVELLADAKIAEGWHLYDVIIPEGGPFPTSFSVDALKGATLVGGFKPVNSKLHKEFDKIF